MTEPVTLTHDLIDAWASDPQGPVALHMRQRLKSVEDVGDGPPAVIFPPTYADIGYNIDTLSDGTKVATIDSVGSQANRMEPLFKQPPLSALVPQIDIRIPRPKKKVKSKEQNDDPSAGKEGAGDGNTEPVIQSLFDLAHRAGDAVVLSCPKLVPAFSKAFKELARGNAAPLAKLAPTSLLFGVWDSRASFEKRPRLVRSVVRAEGLDVIHGAAQYNSIWKLLGDEDRDILEKDKNAKKLADKGFKDVPAAFRKLGQAAARGVPQFLNGAPNPEARVLGGIRVTGEISRLTTINLAALRRLEGEDKTASEKLRRYILALALLIATRQPTDLYLREGCHLKFAEEEDRWEIVPIRGQSNLLQWKPEHWETTLLPYGEKAATSFGKGEVDRGPYDFDIKAAQKLLAAKGAEEEAAEG